PQPIKVSCCFFPAEDGIRDRNVTGVQTCALPISGRGLRIQMRAGEHIGCAGHELEESELVADGIAFDAETVLGQQLGEPLPLLTVRLARRLPVDAVRALDRAETRVHGPISEEAGFAISTGQEVGHETSFRGMCRGRKFRSGGDGGVSLVRGRSQDVSSAAGGMVAGSMSTWMSAGPSAARARSSAGAKSSVVSPRS